MIGRKSTPAIAEDTKQKSFDDFELRLGDIMRGERATLGKSLLDVQRELKIKATYIAAIENADPSAFETPGFVAGYVRSYARYLELDPEWAYATFCQEGQFETVHGMSAQASSRPVELNQRRVRSGEGLDPFADPNTPFIPRGEAILSRIEPSAIGSVLVLIALIGAIGYGGWSVLQEIQRVQFAPIDQAPGVTAEVDPLSPSATLMAQAESTAGYTAPSAEAFDRLYRPQALDVPVIVARDGPISALDPSNFGALAPRDASEAPVAVAQASFVTEELVEVAPPIKVVEDAAPELVLFAVRPAWVRVRGADGTVIFEKILDAGEEFVLPQTEDPPTLRAGNSGSVYFSVNGETYGPAGTGTSVAKNVALAPDALKQNYAVADLSQDTDLARFVAVAEAMAAQ